MLAIARGWDIVINGGLRQAWPTPNIWKQGEGIKRKTNTIIKLKFNSISNN